MSERTLRRHLTDPGMTYSGLLDRIRHEPACDLLQNTAMSIADIAHIPGFSDARGFWDAFKRWADALLNT